MNKTTDANKAANDRRWLPELGVIDQMGLMRAIGKSLKTHRRGYQSLVQFLTTTPADWTEAERAAERRQISVIDYDSERWHERSESVDAAFKYAHAASHATMPHGSSPGSSE